LNPAWIPKALPLRRWQARQLQIETALDLELKLPAVTPCIPGGHHREA
jgi:hypothetical protein